MESNNYKMLSTYLYNSNNNPHQYEMKVDTMSTHAIRVPQTASFGSLSTYLESAEKFSGTFTEQVFAESISIDLDVNERTVKSYLGLAKYLGLIERDPRTGFALTDAGHKAINNIDVIREAARESEIGQHILAGTIEKYVEDTTRAGSRQSTLDESLRRMKSWESFIQGCFEGRSVALDGDYRSPERAERRLSQPTRATNYGICDKCFMQYNLHNGCDCDQV